MKNITVAFLLIITSHVSFAQANVPGDQERKDITAVINQYAKAREEKDTALLKKILMEDIDQLVSNGEWRHGLASAVEGMLKSSTGKPGARTLTVDNIRLINAAIAIVDCKYVIQNDDGSSRNMWSTFILVSSNHQWKISAIRNMLPVK